MSIGLLVIERIVLESVARRSTNIEQLSVDTNLNHSLLKNVLSSLMMKDLIKHKNGDYLINKEMILNSVKKMNSSNYLFFEVKELLSSLASNYFMKEKEACDYKHTDLSLKKVWLSSSDEKIFHSYLYNLETFFNNIEKDRKLKVSGEKLCDKKVVIWGYSSYSRLVQGVIDTV